MQYFTEQFVDSLPQDPPAAVLRIIEKFRAEGSDTPDKSVKYYELVKEANALLTAYLRRASLPATVEYKPGRFVQLESITGTPERDTQQLLDFIVPLEEHMRRRLETGDSENMENRFDMMLGAGFHYTFSAGDLERIQSLINKLRDLIISTEGLSEEHRQRILRRLEKLQSELQKKVSNLDRLYGTVIELSVLARIVGENSKPLVDRIRELVGIVWPAQARAFDLPSDTPFRLPGESDGEDG